MASVPCQIGEKIMVEVREGRISLPPLVYSARTNFFYRFNLLEAWNMERATVLEGNAGVAVLISSNSAIA